MTTFTESIVEEAALCWFGELGYEVVYGPEIAPGEMGAERVSYADVVLVGRLRSALGRLNPHLPADALDEVCRKLTRPDHPSLLENNRRFHRLLVDGVPVSYQGDGRTVHDLARVIDFENVGENAFLAINQFTIIENSQNRRPDVIVFVNGLPLAVIELKNAADANATVKHAFNQLQTYKHKIPSLFPFNELLVISDGLQAKVGTLTSDWERFQPWRTVDGTEPPAQMTPLEVLIRGMFAQERLLDLLQNFIVFEVDGPDVQKKVAAYHQFHAVNKAVACTVRASSPAGDRRIGVVWHTQGSGKSLSMVFYAGKLVRQKEMQNPTLVVLTDRNDLDDQLFGTFARCQDLVRQAPEQVDNRAALRTQLHRASGGIVFTTLQKFTPEDRGDANTRAVFGDYIDIYDISRSVEDGATVRIFYEGRLAKLELAPDDALQLVIVRDMWLTGFDVPCLHTMYVDKPMKGSGLMQAIARVNRVFRDKPGGLIVDYLGIADQLKQALAEYTAGDRNQAGVPQEVAVAKLVELLEVTDAMLHEFDAARFWTGTPAERLTVLLGAQNHVLTLDDGKKRYVQVVTELGRAFALAVPHEKALELRERVGFYQAVKAGLIKTTGEGETSAEDLHTAVRQIVSKAVTSNEVIDIFSAAGLDKPEISILSDEFLAEVQGLEYKNLALEALRILLADQIRAHARTNLVQSRQFSQMLEEAIRRLQNRSLETAQVIAELVELAKQMREANNRGEKLGMTDDELAFYDALEVNDSAVKVLGDEVLRTIARELVKSVQSNVTIDWNVKESARAHLRLLVKRILRKFGYPPDKQEQATYTVLEQTELLCTKWT